MEGIWVITVITNNKNAFLVQPIRIYKIVSKYSGSSLAMTLKLLLYPFGGIKEEWREFVPIFS